MYNAAVFSVVTKLLHQHHNQFQYIFMALRSIPVSLRQSLIYSVSIGLPSLDISYEWSHTICGLWCLASFTWLTVSRSIDAAVYISPSFFFFPV